MKHLKIFESSNELDDIKDILQRVGETNPIVINNLLGDNIEILGSYVIKFENNIDPSKEELINLNLHLKSIGWELISTSNNRNKNEYMFFLMKSNIINEYKKIGLQIPNCKTDAFIHIGDEEINIEISENRFINVSCSDEGMIFKFNSRLLCIYFVIHRQIKYLGIKSHFSKIF